MIHHWHEVTDENDPLLDEAFILYDAAFPEYVREDHEIFLRGIRQQESCHPNTYHFLVALDENNKVISIVTGHYLESVNTGFIVYLATHPEIRGQGLGGKSILKIEEVFIQDAINAGHSSLKGIILETEKETLAEDEEERLECVNRLRFFKKQHFDIVEEEKYLQPPLYTGQVPVPLYLLFKPVQLNEKVNIDIDEMIRAMYQEKYLKVNLVPQTILTDCMN